MDIKNLGEINQNMLPQGIKDLLRKDTLRLMSLIQKHIDKYYDSYTPRYYERTYMFQHSLRYEDIKLVGNMIQTRIYFDEKMATHPSVVKRSDKKKHEDGFIPILIDRGWRWRNNSEFAHRFSFYEGSSFISDAINEFNSTGEHHSRITLEVKHGGSTIERRDYYAY